MARRAPKNDYDTANPLRAAAERLHDRRLEALRVYRPMTPAQELIHKSKCHELLITGGKRSSKTVSGFCEVGSRILGIPLRDMEGNELPLRFPVSTPEDPRLYWFIGWDWNHIGQTIFHKLFTPGLFRVIKDEKTGEYRTWNPADPDDEARKDESEPCGPIIPPRFINHETWAWESAADNRVRQVQLTNGAMLCFYPSTADNPKKGDAVSGITIDEDIAKGSHLHEFQDRLADRDGWFVWTVWPQGSNSALANLIERADEVKELGDPNPNIERITLRFSDNPMIPKAAKARQLERMGDEEGRLRRDEGDLLLDRVAMYDFVKSVHGIEMKERYELPDNHPKTVIANAYRQSGRLPPDWTRYLAIDPSHTRTGVVMLTVPPVRVDGVNMSGITILEGELALQRLSADEMAAEVHKLWGHLHFEAFVMDRCMGAQTTAGQSLSVFETYARAFRKYKLSSRQTKHNFAPGLDVPSLRYAYVREALAGSYAEDNWPLLYVLIEKTYQTQVEFTKYRKKQMLQDGTFAVFDEPARPRLFDLMAALEYGVSYLRPLHDAGMAYVPPSNYISVDSPVLRAARALLSREQSEVGKPYVHLGPGNAA